MSRGSNEAEDPFDRLGHERRIGSVALVTLHRRNRLRRGRGVGVVSGTRNGAPVGREVGLEIARFDEGDVNVERFNFLRQRLNVAFESEFAGTVETLERYGDDAA